MWISPEQRKLADGCVGRQERIAEKKGSPSPVASASRRPAAIHRAGYGLTCASTQIVPAAMYWVISATATAEAGDEAAAWLVVAAHQQVNCDDEGDRQHEPRQHDGNQPLSSGAMSSARWSGVRTPAHGRRRESRRCNRSCCAGIAMLSRAGRKRRSRAYTVSATIPSTVISPSVSKPRKSTSMTLTTLRPPPSLSAFWIERRDALRGGPGQHRERQRQRARSGEQGDCRSPAAVAASPVDALVGLGIRFGSQRSPSKKSTVVTTSTTSWVSARSGAENQTNVRQVTSPATLISVSAASRWNFAHADGSERADAADQPQQHERRCRRNPRPISPGERPRAAQRERGRRSGWQRQDRGAAAATAVYSIGPSRGATSRVIRQAHPRTDGGRQADGSGAHA